jgi:hypothetical protein
MGDDRADAEDFAPATASMNAFRSSPGELSNGSLMMPLYRPLDRLNPIHSLNCVCAPHFQQWIFLLSGDSFSRSCVFILL